MRYFIIYNRKTKHVWKGTANEAHIYSSKKFCQREFYMIVEFEGDKIQYIEDVLKEMHANDYLRAKLGRVVPIRLQLRIKRENKE